MWGADINRRIIPPNDRVGVNDNFGFTVDKDSSAVSVLTVRPISRNHTAADLTM